jgi:hypothetical protein
MIESLETGNKMEPLPIAQIQIEVYNIEESPLHQIVKKLIYKKILDLEPYNFNYAYGSSALAKSIYGIYTGSYDVNEKYSKHNEAKRKEIRETMTWNDPKIKILLDDIAATSRQDDREYGSDPFDGRDRRAITYIPIRPYAGKVFMEYPFSLDGLRIIPDITLMDENGKPETVIEILHTSMPKADKLIKLIESDLNVIFVFADQAIDELLTDMTCRRDYFKFPIREAWLADTPKKEKISRAVNILLQKKMYRDKEYITHKDVITNTEWNPHNKWRKNRMNIGLRITTKYPLGRELIQDNHNLSHSMIQMKETSSLIILLRYLQKYTKEEKTIKKEGRWVGESMSIGT